MTTVKSRVILNIIPKAIQPSLCDGKQCGLGTYAGGGKWACPHTSLLGLFPDLCQEWDYDKNELKPSMVTPGSSKLIWWKCKVSPCECHIWQTKISHRTGVKSGCPFCKINKVCEHNNITVTHPELAKEWDHKRNAKPPTEYTYGSTQKVWWECTKGNCDCHRWEATVHHRSTERNGCPFCIRNRVCPHNNLLVNQPELCLEWDYERNQKRPEEYTISSSDKVWWKCCRAKCECHRWETVINHRSSGTDCPYCFLSKPCAHFNLLVIMPEIAAEWNYDKNEYGPENYSPGSAVKVWWKCKNNSEHEWEGTIGNRNGIYGIKSCPRCVRHAYSKLQIKWIDSVRELLGVNILHALNEGEFKINNVGFVDGYCKETNTVYEFHGDYYHGHPSKYPSDKVNPMVNKTYGELYEKTLRRDQAIRDAGYNLVTMWEHEYLAQCKNKE